MTTGLTELKKEIEKKPKKLGEIKIVNPSIDNVLENILAIVEADTRRLLVFSQSRSLIPDERQTLGVYVRAMKDLKSLQEESGSDDQLLSMLNNNQ